MAVGSSGESSVSIVAVALAVAGAMGAYELLKEVALPGLSHWGSHAITIAVTTALAAAGAAFVAGEQRRASEALRHNEEDLRITLEAIGDAVNATDRRGRVSRMNPVAARLTGWSIEASLGQPLGDVFRIVGAESREPLGDPAARVLATGETRVLGDATVLVARDGHEYLIGDSAAPIRSRAGEVVGVVLVFRDMTSELRLRQQLSQGQRMESVGRLAGGVAHDFNNLLTVILSLVSLMGEGERSAGDLEDLAQIGAAAEHAADLTRQLLAFARKQVIEPKVIDLNDTVGNAERMLRRLIGEDIELTTACPPDLGPILADPGQLEQVVMNLAVNGRDAMPKGGKLTIETANVTLGEDYVASHPEMRAGDHVVLTVSDTGEGMDRETMDHIFEPFFTTKAAGEGTGLGLATCYGIVKQSAGSIWVYSEPGKGTTFKVYFPRVGGVAVKVERPPPGASVGGTEAVLVVEDDAMVRRLAVKVLAAQGYRVTEASNGVEALAAFEASGGAFDMLVTDVIMPKMSGKELVDRLLALRPGLKVLFTSGYTGNTIAHHGIVDRGVNFLGKPYLPEDLLRRVRDVLDRK
jgi:two-component system cell cycle sensor histidine kinase/response regulator CckA